MSGRAGSAQLERENFQTSRLLEYFSEKELTLQTGHESDRWPEVILKELIDNALDACEAHKVLPDVTVTIADSVIRVEDNGPGLPADVVRGVTDFSVRVSSKDAYISPTRGAQGNALKTVLAIPYVLADMTPGPVTITSQGVRHTIRVSLDRIAQEPHIDLVSEDATVRNGTTVEVRWPDSASSILQEAEPQFLQMVGSYGLFNPHAALTLQLGKDRHVWARTVDACQKWVTSEPTSAHWYTAQELRNLAAAYIHAERTGARPRTVREFIAEFRGLSGTAKQKTILNAAGVAGVHLRDFVRDGDVDGAAIAALLEAMQEESRPVKPAALGVLGEAHLTTWLTANGATEITYTKTADVDDQSGLPFIVETAFGVRRDGDGLRLVTGINWAPTLVDPFRSLDDYGLSLAGLLGNLHLRNDQSVTYVLHLACPHLNYTDRGKSSLEGL